MMKGRVLSTRRLMKQLTAMKGGVRCTLHFMKGGVRLYIILQKTAIKGGMRVTLRLMKARATP